MNATVSTASETAAHGFTLVELVACLAVVSLLVGLSVEGVFARVKESLRREETARLQLLGGALRRAVESQRMVPASNEWATLVSQELGEPVERIRRNAAGWERRLIYDPDFHIGIPPGQPPFIQDHGGTPTVTGARAVLLSTMAADLPNLSGVAFAELWNRADDRLPAGWPSRWGGRPVDLILQRISFQDLFSPICLNNLDGDVPAQFVVDGQTNRVSIAGGARVETQFVRGTRLRLLGADGGVQWIEFVGDPASFVCEAGRWRRGFSSGTATVGMSWTAAFGRLATGEPTAWQARPADVALALQAFLASYVEWAGRGFPAESAIPGRDEASWNRLQDAAAQLETSGGLLLGLSPEGWP